MKWETILCLGDSITIGSRSYLGYPEYCGAYLTEKTNQQWNVVNHAEARFTTIDLARWIDAHWSNLVQVNPEIISIMIGTNDIKSSTPGEEFRIAYEQVIIKSYLLIKNQNIILNEIPHLQDGVMLPYHLKMNDQIDSYNKIIQDIAEKEGLMIHRLNASANHFYDGVHLNDHGSKAWGEQLGEKIIQIRKA